MRPLERKVSGDHSGRVTPVPIPNTEVKPASADGTWGETPWESRSSPEFISDNAHLRQQVGIVAPVDDTAVTSLLVANPRGVPGQRRAQASARSQSEQAKPAGPRSRRGSQPGPGPRESERERRARKKAEDDELPAEVRDELRKAIGPDRSAGLERRLAIATRAYERDRYREALTELGVLVRLAPEVAAVRELYGLTLYRLGRWREAVRELRAFHDLTGLVRPAPSDRRLRAGARARQGGPRGLGRPSGRPAWTGRCSWRAASWWRACWPTGVTSKARSPFSAQAGSRCAIPTRVISGSGTRSVTSTRGPATSRGPGSCSTVWRPSRTELFDVENRLAALR